MAMKKAKPTSPGRRFRETTNRSGLAKEPGAPSLVVGANKRKGGRNNNGHITVRHQGGGHKRKYRLIDFKRQKDDISAKVIALEYDPNRSANIALISYQDGEKSYILAPQGLKVGDSVVSGTHAPIKVGNCLPLISIPIGTTIHAVELKPGKGAQLARSAGCSIQLLGKEGEYALVRMKSGETRRIAVGCRATIGEVGNAEHSLTSIGKAGAKRWKGIRPTVRGVAMNPVDHPHGGGEGKTSGGRHPVSPWAQPTKGYKTRRRNAKRTAAFIVRSRHVNK